MLQIRRLNSDSKYAPTCAPASKPERRAIHSAFLPHSPPSPNGLLQLLLPPRRPTTRGRHCSPVCRFGRTASARRSPPLLPVAHSSHRVSKPLGDPARLMHLES